MWCVKIFVLQIPMAKACLRIKEGRLMLTVARKQKRRGTRRRRNTVVSKPGAWAHPGTSKQGTMLHKCKTN